MANIKTNRWWYCGYPVRLNRRWSMKSRNTSQRAPTSTLNIAIHSTQSPMFIMRSIDSDTRTHTHTILAATNSVMRFLISIWFDLSNHFYWIESIFFVCAHFRIFAFSFLLFLPHRLNCTHTHTFQPWTFHIASRNRRIYMVIFAKSNEISAICVLISLVSCVWSMHMYTLEYNRVYKRGKNIYIQHISLNKI